MVDVPVVPAPGLKGDVGQVYPILGSGQGIQVGIARKIPGIGRVGLSQTEHILLFKYCRHDEFLTFR